MRKFGVALAAALVATVVVHGGEEASPEAEKKELAEISFALNDKCMAPLEVRGKKHLASYVVWVEDVAGKYVAPVLLTRTAKYQMEHKDVDILSSWRQTGMPVERKALDAITAATEKPGSEVKTTWRLVDKDGKLVRQGDYVLHVEVAQKFRGHLTHTASLHFRIGSPKREFTEFVTRYASGRPISGEECYVRKLALRFREVE